MPIIYTFNNPPKRPTRVNADNLSDIIGSYVYFHANRSARPTLIFVQDACIVGNYVYIFDSGEGRPIVVETDNLAVCGSSYNEFAPEMVWTFGVGSSSAVQLPFKGDYDVNVDWGDGSVQRFVTGQTVSHVYTTDAEEVEIVITGEAEGFGSASNFPGKNALRTLTSFGNLGFTDLSYMFSGMGQINGIPPTRLPSTVTNIKGMFALSSFNQNINAWNTANVQNMSECFDRNSSFNQPLDQWNTSSVTEASAMFYFAQSFNRNISSWNLANCQNLDNIFRGASGYNQATRWTTLRVDGVSMFMAFDNCGMNADNFSKTLVTFADSAEANNGPNLVTLGANGRTYTNVIQTPSLRSGQTALEYLTQQRDWTISGATPV